MPAIYYHEIGRDTTRDTQEILKELITNKSHGRVAILLIAAALGAQAEDKPDNLSREYHSCMTRADAISGSQGYIAMKECALNELDKQDARLNSVYKKLITTMPMPGQFALRNAERAWVRRKEQGCQAVDNGLITIMAASQCLMTQTAERADFLEKALPAKR
jgi:uncharacterized protein YecT (DUF1311 family)